MTDKDYKSLLRRLNSKKPNRLIQLRPLSESVDYAKVWNKMPKYSNGACSYEYSKLPYNFYFIKNSEGKYVSCVFDMENDLHVFTLPKHRKKGYLTRAIKEVVLNHIFLLRDEVSITIDSNHHTEKSLFVAEKIALDLGFEKQSDNSSEKVFILNKSEYKALSPITEKYPGIEEKRMIELKKEINCLYQNLRLIQTEIEMKMNDQYFNLVMNLTNEQLSELANNFENAWWNTLK